MRGSTERILTTHVGALPAPAGLGQQERARRRTAAGRKRSGGEAARGGFDFVNEGEFTKGGNWVEFVNSRLSGFEPRPAGGSRKLLFGSRDAGKNSATSTRQRWRAARCSSRPAARRTRREPWITLHGKPGRRGPGGTGARDQLPARRVGSIPASEAGRPSPPPRLEHRAGAREHLLQDTGRVRVCAVMRYRWNTKPSPRLDSMCRWMMPGSPRCGTAS